MRVCNSPDEKKLSNWNCNHHLSASGLMSWWWSSSCNVKECHIRVTRPNASEFYVPCIQYKPLMWYILLPHHNGKLYMSYEIKICPLYKLYTYLIGRTSLKTCTSSRYENSSLILACTIPYKKPQKHVGPSCSQPHPKWLLSHLHPSSGSLAGHKSCHIAGNPPAPVGAKGRVFPEALATGSFS